MTDNTDAEFGRITRELIKDIDRTVRASPFYGGAHEEHVEVVADIAKAILSGFGHAADDIALELAAELI